MSEDVKHSILASSLIKTDPSEMADVESTPSTTDETDVATSLMDGSIDVFALLSNGSFDIPGAVDTSALKKNKLPRQSKKSSEIWDHYKLLPENQNVECIYCWKILKRSDSSTKSMWGHMMAYHKEIIDNKQCRKRKRVAVGDSVTMKPIVKNGTPAQRAAAQSSTPGMKMKAQASSSTPTQPYVKRVRAGGSMNASGSSQQQPRKSFSPATTISDNTFSLALQQLSSANLAGMTNSLNFLENIPKSTEIINIPVGFGTATATSNGVDEDEQHENGEAGSSSVSASDERAVSGSPLPVEDHQTAGSGGSPSVTSTNHLSAFMNMAANPLMWNAMLSSANSTSGTGPNSGSAFSLNDGACLTVLMKMAIDLELTLSYHKRRSDIELCFESNRTAEKSGGRGKVLCLSDVGREIRVTERVNGAATDSEMWTKTDFNQFHWAIRGKCQKLLVKQ